MSIMDDEVINFTIRSLISKFFFFFTGKKKKIDLFSFKPFFSFIYSNNITPLFDLWNCKLIKK